MLQQSGIVWNFIRANWFDQNFSNGFIIEGTRSGELDLPAADVLKPFIDVDDIPEVAAAVLTNSQLRNKVFEGPGHRHLNNISVEYFKPWVIPLNTQPLKSMSLLTP